MTRLSGRSLRSAACVLSIFIKQSLRLLFADGGGQNEPCASCSPPRGGGGELRGSKNRKIHTRQQKTAAGTFSEKGRSRRRSVKNRRPFDCFKSAAGIRFSAVARTTPKSFHRGGFWRNLLTSKGCIKKRIRLAESCGPQPLPRGGPLFAQLIHAVSAGCDPKFASEISKIPSKTRKTAKKACKLLYDSIICTTFGTSDPSKCDVNRVAVA